MVASIAACLLLASPLAADSVRLVGGTVNGQSLTPSNPAITVAPGTVLSGSFTVQAVSTAGSNVVIAMGATPTWGTHSSSFVDLGGFTPPTTGINKSVPVSWTAPTTAGTYYIVVAFAGEFTVASVMSCTNWSYGNPVWNDGNDIADWSAGTIEAAMSSGAVQVPYKYTDGMHQNSVPATAIRVVVGGDSGTSSLRLISGTVNGQSVSSSSPAITVAPGTALSGSFTVQAVTTLGSNVVIAMGATPTWGAHSSSFADLGGFSPPTSGTNKSVPVNWTAPTTAGTYYIVAAFSGEFTAGSVMSCTNWSYGNPVWNDGNDIADWSASTIEAAMSNGSVQVPYKYTDGMHQITVPAAAIRVVVVGDTSSVRLVGGTVNGQSISPSSPSVTVYPGASLSGSFSVQATSSAGSNVVIAMGATPTWGSHSNSFVDLGGFVTPTTGTNKTVPVNWTAPTSPGTYYIVVAFSGEFTAASVMSCTNWSYGNPVWNDGNDIADWSSGTIESAMTNGAVQVAYKYTDGMHQINVPATAIRVVVSPPDTSAVRLVSGTVNGQSISPSSPSVNVLPGALLTGSFTVQAVSTAGSNVVIAMGATPTWGTHSSSFVDLGGFLTPTTGINKSVPVNWTAPSTPGTYYIVAAFGGEFTAASVMSCTNWSYGNPVWNDGNDIADWSASTIESAMTNGAVQVPYKYTDGMHQVTVLATAIRVVVANATVSSLQKISGDGQSATTNSSFSLPLVVQATDSTGKPVSGAAVQFTAAGPAALSNSTATTDSNGRAQVTVTAGSSAGSVAVTASIGAISVTFNLTAATQSCFYFVDPLSRSITGDGGSVLALISTGPSCSWTAVSNTSWITISGSALFMGPGAVQFQVAANPNTTTRTGSLTIAGQNFVVNQDAASPKGPVISSIANAASWTSATAGLARGSYVAILGTLLGPAQPVTAGDYPLPTSLGDGGVSVNLAQGSKTSKAFLKFVSAGQINAILPSTLTAGDASLTVTYNGVTSSAVTVKILDVGFGIFYRMDGANTYGIVQQVESPTNYPLNSTATPARPNQILVIWGTGLGPVASDSTAPGGGDLTTAVQITVGGKSAPRLYSGRAPGFSGVDNVYAQLPADVPLGCYQPLQVTVNGVVANSVMISVSADGSPCH